MVFHSNSLSATPRAGLSIRDLVARSRILGLKGLALVVRHRLTGRVTAARFRFPGLPHPFYLRIGTSDFALCWHMFHSREYDFDLQDPSVIIDGDAHTGLSAVWFANRYPLATVYAAEMEASNFALLDLNSAPYSNIVPIRASVWGKAGHGAASQPDAQRGFTVTMARPVNLSLA